MRMPTMPVLLSAVSVVSALAGVASARPTGASPDAQMLDRLIERSRARFEKLDADGDGRLSVTELPRGDYAPRLDLNNDGFIVFDEMVGALRTPLNLRPPANPTPVTPERAAYREVPGVNPAETSVEIFSRGNGTPRPVVLYVAGPFEANNSATNTTNNTPGFDAQNVRAPFFLRQGFTFVNASYRGTGDTGFAGQVEDVAAAVSWVHQNIGRFGGDAGTIFLVGHGFGAQIAALVATDASRLAAFNASPSIIDGVVLLETPGFDLTTGFDGSPNAASLAAAFGQNNETRRAFSPATFVAAGSTLPPFLVFQTPADPWAFEQSAAFVERLNTTGAAALRVAASNRDATTINTWFGRPDDRCTVATLAFFNNPTNVAGITPGPVDGATTEENARLRFQQLFARLDTNRDGTLSQAEVAAYQGLGQRFASFDTDGDGLLTLNEASAVTEPGRFVNAPTE